jgi:arylamine N-acetyltransferase
VVRPSGVQVRVPIVVPQSSDSQVNTCHLEDTPHMQLGTAERWQEVQATGVKEWGGGYRHDVSPKGRQTTAARNTASYHLDISPISHIVVFVPICGNENKLLTQISTTSFSTACGSANGAIRNVCCS